MFSYVVKNNMIWLDLFGSRICISHRVCLCFSAVHTHAFSAAIQVMIRGMFDYMTQNDTTTIHYERHFSMPFSQRSSTFDYIAHPSVDASEFIICQSTCRWFGVVFHRFSLFILSPGFSPTLYRSRCVSLGVAELFACQSNLSYHICDFHFCVGIFIFPTPHKHFLVQCYSFDDENKLIRKWKA